MMQHTTRASRHWMENITARAPMGKQVPADIGLHQDAEGVAPVAHDEVKPRPEDKGRHHQGHDREENGELLLRQPVVHGGAGDQGKGQVDDGNEEGAGDIQQEQAPVGAEVGQKNAQRSWVVMISLFLG